MAGFSSIEGLEDLVYADNFSFDHTERGGAFTTDGQLLIGSTSGNHVRVGTITAGTGTTVTNGPGTITITAPTTNINRPAFLAVPSGILSNVTGDATVYSIVWGTILSQYGSNFSTVTGLFTAPVTGFYQFNASFQVTGLSVGHTTLYGNFTTADGPFYFSFANPFVCAEATFGTYAASGSLTKFLTAGQTCGVQATVTGSTKTVDISTASQFSGFLVA